MEAYDYWSRRKLAEAVGVSHPTIGKLVKKGALPIDQLNGIPVPEALYPLTVCFAESGMEDARERAIQIRRQLEVATSNRWPRQRWAAVDMVVEYLMSRMIEVLADSLHNIFTSEDEDELNRKLSQAILSAYLPLQKRIELELYGQSFLPDGEELQKESPE